jgi:hypothetical protein
VWKDPLAVEILRYRSLRRQVQKMQALDTVKAVALAESVCIRIIVETLVHVEIISYPAKCLNWTPQYVFIVWFLGKCSPNGERNIPHSHHDDVKTQPVRQRVLRSRWVPQVPINGTNSHRKGSAQKQIVWKSDQAKRPAEKQSTPTRKYLFKIQIFLPKWLSH